MGVKPTIGYPTRTDAVRALRGQGLTDAQIGERIGVTAKHVANLVAGSGTADRRQVQSVDAPTPASLIVVPRLTRERLRIYARRRDISVDRLVLDLLDAIAEDRLVDAILGEVGDE